MMGGEASFAFTCNCFKTPFFHTLEHRTVALSLARSLVEVGEQPVCLGTRGLRLNLEVLRGAAPGQGGIGEPVMWQTLILF